KGHIHVTRCLKFFGFQTMPIHKLLEYISDMKIPGITVSESWAIQFLHTLGIDPKVGNNWKTFGDLTQEEVQRLSVAIILKRSAHPNPEDVFTKIYTLPSEERGSPLRDAKEFSTLLNACGRLNKASLGMGACLNDPELKKLALQEMFTYRKELVKALNWFDANKDSDRVFKTDKFMIINAEKNILATMIGTTASILSRGGSLPQDYIILSMAQNTDNTTKISLRVVGDGDSIDCKDLVCKMVEQSAGEAGGHKHAAGAVIPTEKEEAFIQAAKDILINVSNK
ncbi:MAG: DHHA1 domain-containing protein, partial [Nanoarchaeota archaeon]